MASVGILNPTVHSSAPHFPLLKPAGSKEYAKDFVAYMQQSEEPLAQELWGVGFVLPPGKHTQEIVEPDLWNHVEPSKAVALSTCDI